MTEEQLQLFDIGGNGFDTESVCNNPQSFTVYVGDALERLKDIPSGIADCCVTSPPYYALRDYGIDGQIGLEESPDKYIEALVNVFREVKRVLRDDGTLWVNIGDTYNGNKKGNTEVRKYKACSDNNKELMKKLWKGAKQKDLLGIPWMLAFALRNDGWYLRQDIIWSKPNPMPDPAIDRFNKSYEHLFLLSKKNRYYFDQVAVQEEAVGGGMRNKRDVWEIALYPTKDSHFATYPLELVDPCIKAGSRVDGVVLDPFSGSGSTGIAATRIGRDYIGIELNREYVEITKRRARKECGCVVTVK